ncbi:M23 family metallopeptidase [Sphaerisporangium corydalis]|uniref:M23 family metallopeptidase n=1 Tax=Sphaerisporangium corydalis TaxID=1441875 RepID=A0ABV9E5R1_9ACTN|nr:peptidoglycan DD-metalloendopeptidase family protein [Sphaerisporangium corydalis]
MRSGRLAAIAASVLVTAACSAPAGVPGISGTLPPTPDSGVSGPSGTSGDSGTAAETVASAEVTGTPGPSSTKRAEIDAATLNPTASPSPTGVEPPRGDAPVRVPPPRVSRYSYVFPVRGCRVSYARKQLVLPKTTIWAGKGCSFVAPVSGVVHEVNTSNRWKSSTDRGADREGRFVAIVGVDGVRYIGAHLDSVVQGIRPGVQVSAGQPLGRVGDSGNARGGGPNLYFAVSWATSAKYWWVRRGMVDPWSYLDAWLNGNRTLSPAEQVNATRARLGATPPCRTLCASKPGRKPERRPTPSPTSDPDMTTG